MNAPIISVVIPVYNCAPYLKEAIESVLNQTFPDFECIVINDGSTDNSKSIIQSFNDSRIVYTENEQNSGLVYSLNKGLDLAKGQYIARMDGDDICMPDRFQKQLDFLKSTDISFVGAQTIFIDEQGNKIDKNLFGNKNYTYTELRKIIPKINIIPHPTIMGNAEIFKKYRYRKGIKTEDYDLWLRVLSDKIKIEILPDILLQYRVHNQSYTNVTLRKKKNPSWQDFVGKKQFILYRIKNRKFGSFEFRVLKFAIINFVTGIWKSIKNKF